MLYDWLKAFHVIAVISWMAGMLYLPRLYVYHVAASEGSELSETLKVMEHRLLRYIINPAMIATLVFGMGLLMLNPGLMRAPYMHVKLTAVALMLVTHVFFARFRKAFAHNRNQHSQRFFRIVNEVPTVLMVIIVVMILVKPWM